MRAQMRVCEINFQVYHFERKEGKNKIYRFALIFTISTTSYTYSFIGENYFQLKNYES